jgi:hypothetical protein
MRGKGGDEDEDGAVVDSSAGADQGKALRVAAGRHDCQRVYSAPAGRPFQTGSDGEPERTVSDGTTRAKRPGLAE